MLEHFRYCNSTRPHTSVDLQCHELRSTNHLFIVISFILLSGVRLSPLGTAATTDLLYGHRW
jgi:hypothetical protein